MKKRIAFVINPNSGSDRKTDRTALIKSLLSDQYEATIFEWNVIEEGKRIFKEILEGGYDIGVAVGGDGTVSQLASALSGSDVALGIVPFGSGNGLARHLGVPMDRAAAMKLLETGVIKKIDKGTVNGHDFFCTSGTGFDARIGKLFAESTKRGFWTYTKLTLREYASYSSEKYELILDGKRIEREAFLVTTANAGQYGSDAWIAPEASVMDGQLSIVILKPFRIWNLVGIALKLFRKNAHRSRFIETYEAKEITIRRPSKGPAHYDGEPAEMGAQLNIKVVPSCLKVVVDPGFRG